MKLNSSTPFLALVLLLSLSTSISKADDKKRRVSESRIQGKGYSVKVSQVIPCETPRGDTLYSIVYEYEFKNRKSIHIKDLGLMPAKGKLRYLTSSREIVFTTSAPYEAPVLVVPLWPVNPQGGLIIDVPEEDKFPTAARIDIWYSPPSFQERALEVLNKYFTLGVRALQKQNITYCITSFRRLDVTDPEVNGEISLLLSYPYETAGNKSSFRAQFLVRENRAQSTEGVWRYGISQDTRQPAEDFINKVMGEFKTTK